MLGLKPITLLPARERVASELRKAIISKQIQQGEILTLEATAQELGVSVTPVREAFQILARDNLIELSQNKKAVVLGINKQTIREHYQVRAALESMACVLCCQNNADLTEIENCVVGARQALERNDSGIYSNFNQSFHYEIWKAANNEKMKNMLSELWNGLSMGIKISEAEYAEISQSEHEDIFEALASKDAERSRVLMFGHIERSMNDILTRYEE